MFSYGNLQTPISLSPQTSIIIHNPLNTFCCDVKAIVDTGAAMTCIPESEIRNLERSGRSLIYDTIRVIDANGNIQERTRYLLNITIASIEYPRFKVIAISKNYALIGRDILNNYKVVLNAPQQRWGLNCCNEHICLITDQNG
jgi:predicted aspartyl protease